VRSSLSPSTNPYSTSVGPHCDQDGVQPLQERVPCFNRSTRRADDTLLGQWRQWVRGEGLQGSGRTYRERRVYILGAVEAGRRANVKATVQQEEHQSNKFVAVEVSR
jgi:hypothetical protein